MQSKLWKKWLRQQNKGDLLTIAEVAIERLMELEEVAFQQDDFVDRNGEEVEDLEEMLYWTGSGTNLLDESDV